MLRVSDGQTELWTDGHSELQKQRRCLKIDDIQYNLNALNMYFK